MFMHNVEKCTKIFDEVFVSSDSIDIIDTAESAGAIGIIRPEYLTGDTPNIPVYRHAMEKMGKVDAIVAVQANSPTISRNTITFVKKLMLMGTPEVMTCHKDLSVYGSIWAMTADQLDKYGDPYKPTPSVLVVDDSTDIHTEEDLQEALIEYEY